MYIPDHIVDEVRMASDIVEVVSDYVKLKKRGSNFVGLCPFHSEKTPSFNVNPNMGIYKCFGCSKGGNVFQFMMELEQVTFPEAVRTLAEKAGIVIPEDDTPDPQQSEAEAIYNALRFAARFFYERLTQTEAGKVGLDYLLGRGFTPQTIKKFGLGYAPNAWDSLLNAAEEAQIKPTMLEKAGLVIPRKDSTGYYDRYRHRVIFPIFSRVGKVLGFGGRILVSDPKQPKYINSPETNVYHKSRVIYGLYHAKQAMRKREEVILVEGYTDVISLHQAGVEHVVASSGTALTEEQVKMLGRYAKRVLLLYDADSAGANASVRGIDLVLAQKMAVYAVSLPPGADPDSYVREHGAEAFEAYLQKHRQDWVEFMYDLARRSGDLATPEGTAEAQRRILASVARIPDPLQQESYLRRASSVLDIPDMQLRPVLGELLGEQQRHARRQAQRDARQAERASEAVQASPASGVGVYYADEEHAERYEGYAPPNLTQPQADPLPEEKILIRLMLERGSPMVEFILGHMAADEFTEGPARQIIHGIIAQYQEGKVDKNRFVDGSQPAGVQRLAAEVLMDLHEPSQNWAKQSITVPRLNQNPEQTAISAMTLLKLDRVDEAIEASKQAVYHALQQGKAVRPLQENLMQLHELRKYIAQRQFIHPAS